VRRGAARIERLTRRARDDGGDDDDEMTNDD